MIQRSQSLYLLLSLILIILAIFFPLINFENETSLTVFAFNGIQDTESILNLLVVVPGILLILSAILCFVSIFLFKNRKVQIRIVRFSIIIISITILFIFLEVFMSVRDFDLTWKLQPALGIISLLISIVFLFLSIGGIKRDEALIRSADRIR